MNPEHVYLNGKFALRAEACVPALDRGLLYGDGVFETLRVYQGRIFAFEQHARRLYDGLTVLGISIPETAAQLLDACRRLLEINHAADTILRITVTRGLADGPLGLPPAAAPTRLIHCRPLSLPSPEDYQSGVRAVIAGVPFSKSPPLARIKSLNYLDNLLAKEEARKQNAFEALLVNQAWQVIEGASSNVFAVRQGEVITPPVSAGALPGITRAFCLDLLRQEGIPAREGNIEVQDLPALDEFFLTNSVIEILPVVRFDRLAIGPGRPGPICRLLQKAYSALIIGI